MSSEQTFDAIVVGSGITGGWAAKELTERGLKVLMIERGRNVEHQADYTTETLAPWELPFRGVGDPAVMKDYASSVPFANEWNHSFFVNERENPFQTAEDRPFDWVRGYQLGGKSLIWGRQCYRWSDYDFGANKRDGHGVDWPIRYADLAPWYDHVEQFAGIAGSIEGLPQLPDGKFQPPMELNHVEKAFKTKVEADYPNRKVINGRTANMTEDKPEVGRTKCQYRNICSRGCSYGGYFSTQSATLPAAKATGRLTVVTDTRIVAIDYDPATKRATGVRGIVEGTRKPVRYDARIIFVCAGALNTLQLLLLSRSQAFPNGLGNLNDRLGRGVMDHAMGFVTASIPGYLDRTYFGWKPTGFYIPRFRNIAETTDGMLRGYGLQGSAVRGGWQRGLSSQGVGADFKNSLRASGGWTIYMVPFAECLPRDSNQVTLDETHLDPWGLPQLKVDVTWSDNEFALIKDGVAEGVRMLEGFGGKIGYRIDKPTKPPGGAIHEMGGAAMGLDPRTSVLNKHNQLHDIPNLFVTDGAAMSSSACQNPSLTYMALTARACATAVSMLKENKL
jgi:choline dehydrogenase-like flavoprotein